VSYRIVYTKQAIKDAKMISASGLKEKTKSLLDILQKDPFQTPPCYERLVGDLSGTCSRRINIQHRLVYEVLEEKQTVKVLRMWSPYGE